MPVVHSVGISIGVGSAVGIGTIVARTPRELSDALKQREKAVVIEDKKMASWFRSVEAWQGARPLVFGTLIAAVLVFAISQRYKIEMSWHRDWEANTLDGKVTLTPVERK